MIALLLLAALAAPPGRLDGLEEAVRERWEGMLPSAGPRPRDQRALRSADRILAEPRDGLLDDLRAARPAARLLDRWWPEFDGELETAFGGLRAAVLEERAGLVSLTGRVGSPRREALLGRAVAAVQRRLERADGTEGRAARARLWLRACARIRAARRALGIVPPQVGPPPFEGAAPAFSLLDANPNSPGYGLPDSPGARAGQVTAWYFTRLG